MQDISGHHPLRRLFAGLVEDAFCTRVGMCNPALTDYLADLLVGFTHIRRLNAIRNARGKRLDQIAAMLAVMSENRPTTAAERDQSVYRNIGDYTLFWAGVYPEYLKRTRHDQSDILLDYVQQGRRSYAIVSDLADEADAPPSSLFRNLSEDFEFCLYGLSLVRQGLEQKANLSSGPRELLY